MKAIAGWAVVSIFLLGCSQQGTGPAYETGSRSSSDQPVLWSREVTAPRRQSSETHSRSAKMEFLNSIREADPRHQTIERALMNEQNELGIVLSRQVSMDDIPTLMRSLLKQMSSRFPGEDLTIIAYAPADPPLKIGTARLDAQTREMTYTPTQRQIF
jgi:hypothetical protein